MRTSTLTTRSIYISQSTNKETSTNSWIFFINRRKSRSASESISEIDKFIPTMRTEMPLTDIKIVDQKYSQNKSGEYKHDDGGFRAEQGEYEDRNGVMVFVIRGVFSYNTRQGTYNTTLYIVDEFGYHNIQPPPHLMQVEGGLVDYRPDVQTSTECGNEKENYCIDQKLLALLDLLIVQNGLSICSVGIDRIVVGAVMDGICVVGVVRHGLFDHSDIFKQQPGLQNVHKRCGSYV
ncbi:hypothetical protein Bhyg_15705 [Pseudolycoriella hygida]|uniref:Uncharacterized protein n=1 Tax=Pseudolycoriella hygida TaxID=35572 RepID=A0A9Q0ML20_9DIPT|nr:hypothetical protein Bhyg_15705 [Pseudolycoriella hygida]